MSGWVPEEHETEKRFSEEASKPRCPILSGSLCSEFSKLRSAARMKTLEKPVTRAKEAVEAKIKRQIVIARKI